LDLEAGVACFFVDAGVPPLAGAFRFLFTVGVSTAGDSADTPAAQHPHTYSTERWPHDAMIATRRYGFGWCGDGTVERR
jgi:hypothetical protein